MLECRHFHAGYSSSAPPARRSWPDWIRGLNRCCLSSSGLLRETKHDDDGRKKRKGKEKKEGGVESKKFLALPNPWWVLRLQVMCTRLRRYFAREGSGYGHGYGTGAMEMGDETRTDETRVRSKRKRFTVQAESMAERRESRVLFDCRRVVLSRRLRSSRQRRPFAGKCSAGRKGNEQGVRNQRGLNLIGSQHHQGHNVIIERRERTDLIAQPSVTVITVFCFRFHEREPSFGAVSTRAAPTN